MVFTSAGKVIITWWLGMLNINSSGNIGFFPEGCSGCNDSDRYEGHMRLAQFDVASGNFDWYHEQTKWFGTSTAISHGNWGTNDIFLGGAVDDKKLQKSDTTMEWAPAIFHMKNDGKKHKLWKLKISNAY